MRIVPLLVVVCLLIGCEELPRGTSERVWPDVMGEDALPLEDAAPDRGPALRFDAAPPPDGTPTPDMAPPSPICQQDDEDGDGHGQHPACPRPDCDETNRAIHPGAPEACNGLDDDCDDAIDEGLNDAVCGIGACRRQVANCVDGQPTRCVPGTPEAEACNGIDDDCDGAIDEGAPTASCGLGRCQRMAACIDGAVAECVPGAGEDEACNRLDDDCDGATDEGFQAEVVVTTYGALFERHAACDGGTERIGPGCNAAMNRFCAGHGCAVTGYGPVENSGDTAVVTCVASAALEVVSFVDLAAQHDVCDGQRERIGPNCNAAIHRWCADQGHISGFGPQESGAADIQVACVTAGAEVRGVPYAALSAQHGPCDGNRQRIGPDCNAAIHRWCRGQGFVSGFGPVENIGGDATVVCLRR